MDSKGVAGRDDHVGALNPRCRAGREPDAGARPTTTTVWPAELRSGHHAVAPVARVGRRSVRSSADRRATRGRTGIRRTPRSPSRSEFAGGPTAPCRDGGPGSSTGANPGGDDHADGVTERRTRMSETLKLPTTKLFLLEELDDMSRTRELAQGGLDALRAVADWITTFVTSPHKDLGRAGPVCPFVPGALVPTLLARSRASPERSVPMSSSSSTVTRDCS